jgi:hypothetical protein
MPATVPQGGEISPPGEVCPCRGSRSETSHELAFSVWASWPSGLVVVQVGQRWKDQGHWRPTSHSSCGLARPPPRWREGWLKW